MPEGLEFWTATEVAECLIDDRDLRIKLLGFGDHTPARWWDKISSEEKQVILSSWTEATIGVD